MNTNLELYKVFYTVATQQSVTAASEFLCVSQPAVSQAVRQLEEKLGVRLFDRNPRGMSLTKTGKTLFHFIEQAYHLIDKGEKQLADISGLSLGEIHISAGDTICRKLLLPVIQRFHRKYPGIKMHVTNRTSSQTVELLRSGKIDMGIVSLPVEIPEIRTEIIHSVHDTFVCSSDLKAEIPEPATLEDISRFPLLFLEEGTITRVSQEAQFIKRGLFVKPEIELGSLDLLVDFAKIGMGIACVPREFYAREIETGEVLEISMKEYPATRQFGAAYRNDIPLTELQRTFLEYLHSDDMNA